MQKSVECLLENPAVRRANHAAISRPLGWSTGFHALDAALPDRGWPSGSLTEILSDREGIGELSLLMPALAAMSSEKRWIAWISPPHIPYGPALSTHGVDLSRVLLVHAQQKTDALWSFEQALASGTCGAVLGWVPRSLDERMLRRLQLAAERGHSVGFLFRSAAMAMKSSPAALRLSVEPTSNGLQLRILKCRGRSGVSMLLDVDHALVEPVFSFPSSGYSCARKRHH